MAVACVKRPYIAYMTQTSTTAVHLGVATVDVPACNSRFTIDLKAIAIFQNDRAYFQPQH